MFIVDNYKNVKNSMKVIILVPTGKVEIKEVASMSDNPGCLRRGE